MLFATESNKGATTRSDAEPRHGALLGAADERRRGWGDALIRHGRRGATARGRASPDRHAGLEVRLGALKTHVQAVGGRVRERVNTRNELPHPQEGPTRVARGFRNTSASGLSSAGDTAAWQVTTRSTNYQRTKAPAEGSLDGFGGDGAQRRVAVFPRARERRAHVRGRGALLSVKIELEPDEVRRMSRPQPGRGAATRRGRRRRCEYRRRVKRRHVADVAYSRHCEKDPRNVTDVADRHARLGKTGCLRDERLRHGA